MIGGEHAVELAGARHDRRLNTFQLFGEEILAVDFFAPTAGAVGVLQAGQELLRQLRFLFPARRVQRQLRDAGAVITWLVAEQP